MNASVDFPSASRRPLASSRLRRLLWSLALATAPGLTPAVLSLSAVPAALAQEANAKPEPDFKDELPRIPPTSPADALKTFQTRPGFRVEQIAAEPLLQSPVAVSYDADGRAFVAGMVDYSEQDKDSLGIVRLLTDTNGDGVYDQTSLFAEGLSWPTAICCYDGGVFVGAAPHIYYLKDTDGDGKADVRQTVFTGFGRGNVQGLFNSFHWGLDNRIHGATSTSGGAIRRGDLADAPAVNLGGRDFSFDPKTLDLRPESGGAQHGMSFDDFGRKFVSSNSDHIQLVMYEDRYIARNPSLAAPGPRVSIALDGPQAEVFRISPVEPWRIVRTRLRVSGQVPGPVEGGGRAAGYFTGATGVTIYRGDAWPAEYHGQAFVGDVGSNIVHRKRLEPDGVALVARRADEQAEFLASTDIWFRPAQFTNGPDGTLHVIDVCRETIEHPASLPPAIKKHLDLTSGRDRGRLYRLVPTGFQQPKIPQLSKLSTAELVPYVAHANAWHRLSAQRLLVERAERAVAPALEQLARQAPLPQGRLHALYALAGLKLLPAGLVAEKLADAHPGVRLHALRLAEPLLGDSAELRDAVVARADDPSLLVRYQLAFTLGEMPVGPRVATLARLLAQDGGDKWVRLACASSLTDGAGEALATAVQDPLLRRAPYAAAVATELSLLVGQQGRADDVTRVITAIEQLPADAAPLATVLVKGLSDGLAKGNSPLRQKLAAAPGKSRELLAELLADARQKAAQADLAEGPRVEAIRTLGLGEFAPHRELLQGLLDSRQPLGVQGAALATLQRFNDPAIGPVLTELWPGLSPKLRPQAMEAIFSRPEWLLPFLEAVAKQEIPAADVEPQRFRLLTAHGDERVKKQAVALADKIKLSQRQDVLAEYEPALKLGGNVEAGRTHFRKVCSVCHKLEGFGHEIGPNLATVQNRGAEAILVNVLDPNREVNPQYVNYILQTNAGKSITGLVAAETATSVTLRRQENQSDTVLRGDIDTLRSSGLSIMPEGLEKNLDKQAMADLIAYLLSQK
jgi:putative membrane-bound dehydrogenase-like protein